jgi:branched-chain amino acid transport system ATP-binding protein
MSLLELENVETRYGQSRVLHGVSMSVDDDEVVVLLGRNGAGKSTTLKSIMGLQPITSGDIRYDGESIAGEAVYDVASRGIKYVPEDRRVFDKLTVREHLVMAVESDHRTAEEEIDRIFGIFPQLEALSNRQAEYLSGGEQQMLVIGRALVGPTELLLLDEPSEGLAPQIVERIFETITRLKENVTILLVEQNFSFASALGDRYYILDQGEIVSEGPMASLEADEELRAEYLGVT